MDNLTSLEKHMKKKNKSKNHKCSFCSKIYNGYTVKEFPFIYYESDKNKFALSSEYQGHGGTKYLEDISFCPKCGRDLYKK